ncbi:ROK family protein [Thermorudis peleae]|uniref:ROK family protein n=1 Tax=Thermorudis peleae TaxID=1382356 RepID=UPI001E490E33|nr:ROK family protein [Thermorudis peleae]
MALSISQLWQLSMTAEPVLVLGIEISGTGQRAVVADQRGQVHGRAHAPNGVADALSALTVAQHLAEEACRQAGLRPERLAGCGVAFGGPVDPQRGTTLWSHRAAGFEQFPLVALLEERLGIHAVLDNDARAAALGEAAFGAGRGCQNIVYVHLASGVGGGIIVDGRPLYGTSSAAGEIGHMVVTHGGPLCSCGKPGHLEAYASAPAIVRRAREQLVAHPDDPAAGLFRRRVPSLRQLFQHAPTSPVLDEVVRETVQTLGIALANLITALNPEVVIVGGPVAEVGAAFLGPLQARVRQYSYPAALGSVRVTTSELGSDAIVLGAAALALAHQAASS